jgi:hypothetical protein
MGYVHDTHMSQFIPPNLAWGDTATWAMGAGQVAHTKSLSCDATDETATLHIPVMLPSNSQANKGAYLKSIEIDFEILTAACDAMAATIYKLSRGADGAAATATSVDFSYDTGHDAAAERIDVDQHKMTLTLDTAAWIDNDEEYWVEVAFDKAATTTVDFLGAVANFTLRA